MVKIFKKNFLIFIPLVLLLVFIFSLTGNNYYIGGDLIFPLKPENNILRSLFLWEEQNGGFSFFKYMLLLWQAIFYFFSVFNIPSYLSIKLFIVILYVLGFLSAFFSYKILFKKTKYSDSKFAILAALIFFLNPASILVLVGSIPLYGFPLCFLFILKFLESKNLFYTLPFAFFFNLAFFPDLPQAKFLTIFVFCTFFLVWLFSTVQRLRLKNLILPILQLFFVTVLLNAFVIIPFLGDAFGEKGVYQNFSREVGVYEGNADLYSASLPYISRFYNSNLIDAKSKLGQFLSNPIFILWTYFLWIVALIGMLLVKDRKDKRIMFILLIPLISIIFIAKGVNPPFGEVYRFLLINFPVFKIFRTTAALAIGGVMFYAILVTMAVYTILNHLSKKQQGIFYLFFIFIHIIIFHPIYLGYKLSNSVGKEKFQMGFSIPGEYFKMGKFLDDLQGEDKVLALPLDDGYVAKTWYYSGQSPISWITKKPLFHNPSNILDNSYFQSFPQTCMISSLYNIQYLLQEKDTSDKLPFKNLAFSGETLFDDNYFSLKKIDNKCFLPRLYIPENIIYFQGDTSQIPFLAEVPDFQLKSLIYHADQKKDFLSEEIPVDQETLDKSNQIILGIKPENLNQKILAKDYIRLDLDQKNIADVFYPYVRIEPDSPFYPLALRKEDSLENNSNANKRLLLDNKLFLASKRISEIEKWGINNNWWGKMLDRYRQKMEETIDLAKQMDQPLEGLQIILSFKNAHLQKIHELAEDERWEKEKIDTWENIFEDLSNKLEKANPLSQFSNFEYSFKPPAAGNYRLFLLNKESISKTTDLEILLNDKTIASYDASLADRGVLLDLGRQEIKLSDNKLIVKINSVNLINPQSWQRYDRKASVDIIDPRIVFSDNQQEESQLQTGIPVLFQDISDWEHGATYLFKIKYKTYKGATLKVLIKEKREIYDSQANEWKEKEEYIVKEEIGDGKEYSGLIKANSNSLAAKVYFYGTNGIADVENIELRKLIIPTVILEMKKEKPRKLIPEIMFTKINPTKYRVKITKAKDPYFLIFSESFDKGWKAYFSQNQKPVKGMIATLISDMINKSNSNNIFLNENTFENWGKPPFSEEKHYLVNGYANAWFILPEDTGGINNYEIILEYFPQRLLYIGGIISLLTASGIFFLVFVRKKYEKNKKY